MKLWQKLFPGSQRTLLSPKKRKKKKTRMTWREWTLLIAMIAIAAGIAIWMGSQSKSKTRLPGQPPGGGAALPGRENEPDTPSSSN